MLDPTKYDGKYYYNWLDQPLSDEDFNGILGDQPADQEEEENEIDQVFRGMYVSTPFSPCLILAAQSSRGRNIARTRQEVENLIGETVTMERLRRPPEELKELLQCLRFLNRVFPY